MPPFIYSPYHAPYTGAIADTMLIPGQAQARAAEQSGQAWSQAAQQIGQGIAGAAQQVADPRRQLEQQQVEANKRTLAFNDTINKISASLFAQQPDGSSPIDLAKAKQMFTAANVPVTMQSAVLKELEGVNESITKFNTTRIDHVADVAHGALQSIKAGADPQTALAFGIAAAKANHLVSDDQIQPLIDAIGQGADVTQLLTQVRGFSEKYKDANKPVVVPEGGTLVTPGQTKPDFVSAPKPTEASLAVDAAAGKPDAQKALDLMRAQKNPPSLEEQYLTAVSKGDKATAGTILKSIADTANAKKDPAMQAMAKELAGLRMDEARARLDERNPTSEKNQAKFEQEYRTVLARGLSSRSGGLGLEDAKVQQANHLLALLDQTYDPKTDSYSIPKVLQGELAAGLARLVAPGGQVGIEMMREFNQKTAKEGLANALTYITGTPFPTATQDIAKMLKDSIERQGHVALENREGEMRYLRGLAPTDLDEARRTKLEATSLNPLRQSRIAVNAKGERRVFVSTDGGQTWK